MDTSSCLPTPEAILKLNLEVIVTPSGKCISSKTRNKTIIDELIRLGFIEPYHAEYGMTFTVLRDVWLGKLAVKAAMLSDSIIAEAPHISPGEFYDLINRQLMPGQRKIVFWAIEAPWMPINAMIGYSCNVAFEKLADAFLIASGKK